MRLRATTRLPPHVWPTNANIANSRLSFPVTYWNVVGLLAPFGIVLWLPAEPVTSGRDSSIQATTARLEMWRIARHEFQAGADRRQGSRNVQVSFAEHGSRTTS
jgi:hypothetical protein